jgi:hypothetical protein
MPAIGAGIASSPFIRVLGLWLSARVARRLGEIARAESLIGDALSTIAAIGPKVLAPDVLDVAAALRSDVGADVDAARLVGASAAAREEMGLQRRQDATWDVDEETRGSRDRLGVEAFEIGVAEGRALRLDDALAYALRGTWCAAAPGVRVGQPHTDRAEGRRARRRGPDQPPGRRTTPTVGP